ncbi:conserved hypothetical protein [Frankia canadensis]|uniref:Cucumopine synthase C-terminal helical bundle domain-containing protein n=1 Tax=Frankia canadensis TaxID=1836972 RepID=A0A2I2KJI7_9ACTN|nr:hypothetical protein [Frankia canadensis]SNQ45814.1 conserved hypothetical protein [Frankia canadensis]SOU53104.1 conserved hypothetical protein [Frankia canadensis]
MSNTVDDMIAVLEAEREAIWLTIPDEVAALGRGEVPRGTGARGQYLSTLMFAEGEARTLSDEMLWGVIQVCEIETSDLATLQSIIKQIIGYKADFFDFVGLPHAASLIHAYVAAACAAESLQDLHRLTSAAISYANRLHMTVDAVYPWALGNAFPRKDRAVV